MKRIQAFIRRLWGIPLVNKAVHTFWQTFAAVFVGGWINVFSAFKVNLTTGESALLALAIAAGAAGLSAVKTTLIAYGQTRKQV